MAWTVIGATGKGSTDTQNVTTDPIDTTGATLLIVVQVATIWAGLPYMTDSEGNTWHGNLVVRQTGGVWDPPVEYVTSLWGFVPFGQPDGHFYCQQLAVWFCRNPITSATHTFSSNTSSIFPLRPTILALAMSGVDQGPNILGRRSPLHFDPVTGGDKTYNQTNGSTATSLQNGSFTPQEDNALAISVLTSFLHRTSPASIDDGFTIAAQVLPVGGSAIPDFGICMGGAIAYKIQTTAEAFDPTWSWTGSDHALGFNLAFMGDGLPASVIDTTPVNITFSALIDTGLHDWKDQAIINGDEDGADFDSYFYTFYHMSDDTMFWMYSPNLVTVISNQTTTPDGIGCILQPVWEWAENSSSVKFAEELQLYRSKPYQTVVDRKWNIRGKGRALQLRFNSEEGKDFNVLGWGMELNKNDRP